ncbi:tetratricopeptide repeat protein [Jannaschia sp. LMIT008]|uniref:tetratricopeptide repeat protein n=1 Tax=Jannaschia maritima TaxID=3032585 RepID=UPI0028125712|nr:tetratricopeptide repeat protein [Jannaschia sp. LMIT008]
MRPGGIAVAVAVLLCACAGDGGDPGGDPLRAPGPADGSSVDPLIVGDRLLAAGEAEAAMESYVRAAALRGPTPEVRRAIAGANLRLGRLGLAERDLRALVRADPDDPRAWNDLGVVQMERGEIPQARQSFRRAFALDPRDDPFGDNLRLSLSRLDRLRYDGDQRDAFTLTRRDDGTFRIAPRSVE